MNVTYAKIKKACRQANWSAIHATCCEYRVVLTEYGEIEVQEWLQGSNGWRPGEMILKTYCYWPSLSDYILDGPVDAVAITWLQNQFIENQLDEDAAECWEIIKETTKKESCGA